MMSLFRCHCLLHVVTACVKLQGMAPVDPTPWHAKDSAVESARQAKKRQMIWGIVFGRAA